MSRKSLSQEEEAQIIADAIANRDDETVNLTITTVRIVPNVSAVLSVEVSMEELGLLSELAKEREQSVIDLVKSSILSLIAVPAGG